MLSLQVSARTNSLLPLVVVVPSSSSSSMQQRELRIGKRNSNNNDGCCRSEVLVVKDCNSSTNNETNMSPHHHHHHHHHHQTDKSSSSLVGGQIDSTSTSSGSNDCARPRPMAVTPTLTSTKSSSGGTTSSSSGGGGGGGGNSGTTNTTIGMTRCTKSMFSMSSTSSSTSAESSLLEDCDHNNNNNNHNNNNNEISSLDLQYDHFGQDVRIHTQGVPDSPAFDGGLRKVMEPHLRRARMKRERSRSHDGAIAGGGGTTTVDASIADSIGVPYTSLRHERPFLFDEHSYPLHTILAKALQVNDLSTVHELDTNSSSDAILTPLLDPVRRRPFHAAYDNFVTSFCIPLLHSLAIAKNVLHTSSSDQITYRYQAFPTVRVVTPGSTAIGPMCDLSDGHSIGCLHFHIPLTPSFGTNALYAESHPGKENWHPLSTKSVGLGYLFDGARCLHFEMENTTNVTRVSLDFRVLVYREFYGSRMVHDGGLCPESVIEDCFSRCDPNYYDEAIVDLGHHCCPHPGSEVVIKKYGDQLQPPSSFDGPPFS